MTYLIYFGFILARCIQECATGKISQETAALLCSLVKESSYTIPTDATYLAATNDAVDFHNAIKLAHHEGKLWRFISEDQGEQKVLNDNVLCLKKLYVKVGAPVIVTRNIIHLNVYNGTTGTIAAIDLLDGTPTVSVRRSSSNSIFTLTPRDLIVQSRNKIHRRRQLPIKLAWGLTVHHSQGQTFDKIHIDCSRMYSSCHLNVSLSRAQTAKNVTITNLELSSMKPPSEELLHFLNTGEVPVQVGCSIVLLMSWRYF